MVAVRLLKLYYSKRFVQDTSRSGHDLNEVFELLKKAQSVGVKCEVVDTDQLSDEELSNAYIEAIMPSVLKKYRVRQVFGSRRHSGSSFGRQVPALVVHDSKTNRPVDVYPHEVGLKKVQITDFLKDLVARAGSIPTS